MFTQDNTSGYTKSQLSEMNAELENLMNERQQLWTDEDGYINSDIYEQELKSCSEIVFNRYC
jgi:hypothetical protein